MAKMPSSKDPKGKTPAKYNGPADARQHPGAGTYPNYYSHKTRSGHVILIDDSKGAEHITIQHRGGSMIQFMPDGAVQFVSHNGRYQFTFGEDRILVTGAQDIVVQGAASLRVEKDYNMTVMGDMNTTVDGNFNLTAKNFHADIGGNIDIVSKNMTVKTQGSMEFSAHQTATFAGHDGVAISSPEASVGIVAKDHVGVHAYDAVMIQSDGDMDIKSGGHVAIESSSETDIKSGGSIAQTAGGKMSIQGSPVAIDGSTLLLNSGGSEAAGGAVEGDITLTEPIDQNDDRDKNPIIERIFAEEDNGLDDEIVNTTLEATDDIFGDKDDTDYEPGQIPPKKVT
jgi:hypothetical protein